MNAVLEPGMLVRHPDCPDWGVGQVQSNIGGRITVNFEHQGKVVIDGSRVDLRAVFTPNLRLTGCTPLQQGGIRTGSAGLSVARPLSRP